MSDYLFLATRQGLHVAGRTTDGWRLIRQGLAEHRITAVIAREGVVLAGTRAGVFRSDDLGRSWSPAASGLATPYVRWLAYHPDFSDREFAGTEPADVFVSQDGARSWQPAAAVAALRDSHRWYLPYSPAAGCIRDFAISGDRLYAAAEVGGALRSDDGGFSWRLLDGRGGDVTLHPDVHNVAVVPGKPDAVYAAASSGLYFSPDGGDSWTRRHDTPYCRAVWINPRDPDELLLGPAAGVDRGGALLHSTDGGRRWSPVGDLGTPWPRTMVERFAAVGDQRFAVLSDGSLLTQAAPGRPWLRLDLSPHPVAALCGMG